MTEMKYVVDSRPLCQGMRFVLTDAAHPRHVLKHGNHFLVLDASGLIPACNTLGYGYYRDDTRYLSQWEMYVDEVPLSLLSSRSDEGFAGTFFYTNAQTSILQQQKLTVLRELVLSDSVLEKITIENFHPTAVEFELTLLFQSDFADMFEVRGLNLPERGERMLPVGDAADGKLCLAYRCLDGVMFETTVECLSVRPNSIRDGRMTFRVSLLARQSQTILIRVTTGSGGVCAGGDADLDFATTLKKVQSGFEEFRSDLTMLETSQELFNLSVNRSLKDLYILRQSTPRGIGIGAGVPWYCAVFGRDSAITSLQLLPFAPILAKETLSVLAAYQGREDNTFKAEHPGRIMHELRLGELARLGKIPHGPYYGTVDATQLWVLLLARYYKWTGDLDFALSLYPALKAALDWLKLSLVEDQAGLGGYISYLRESPQGLENQGWKDSGDAVMHKDGRLAEPPIALCEPQGYLYQALTEISSLVRRVEGGDAAQQLLVLAEDLKARFVKDFWMEEEGFLALGLDRYGKQLQVISSNPGHCLAGGIVDQELGLRIAERIMRSDLHTEWGIRTLADSALSYNPISYHNGSIWPHDNSMIVEGLARLGRLDYVHELLHELFAVMLLQPDYRLPELYCGFDKSEAPINYPVSCSPQAWAAGSIFQLLASCLRMEPDAGAGFLRISEPALPAWLEEVNLTNLAVGKARLDLRFSYNAGSGSTSCQVLRKQGDIKVIIEC